MNESSIYYKINSLSENMRVEAMDFIDFLLEKNKQEKKNKTPKFGSCRGLFKMMPNFDEPIEDFKEYMY
jgi:hypothetical protein